MSKIVDNVDNKFMNGTIFKGKDAVSIGQLK